MEFRKHFDYDLKAASDEAAIQPGDYGESMTVQSMAEDADINVLMKRYGVTGKLPENPRVPMYGDFSHVTDFRSAIESVRSAERSFMEFPAEVRAQFANDPQRMLEFVADDRNYDAARKLGLLKEVPNGRGSEGAGAPSGANSQSSSGGGSADSSAARGGSAPGGGSAGPANAGSAG